MIFIIPEMSVVSCAYYNNPMNTSYPKKEKLKSKKLIEQLFIEGKSISVFPLRLVYLQTEFLDDVTIKASVSVSKRYFKSAVDRNYIKRLMREAYRLNKPPYFNNFSTQYAFMILYIGKTKPTFAEMDKKMKLLFEKFHKEINKK